MKITGIVVVIGIVAWAAFVLGKKIGEALAFIRWYDRLWDLAEKKGMLHLIGDEGEHREGFLRGRSPEEELRSVEASMPDVML